MSAKKIKPETSPPPEISEKEAVAEGVAEAGREKMENFVPDSEYHTFNNRGTELGGEKVNLPPRYKPKTLDPEKQARAQARAESRRASSRYRRTLRLQKQQQQQERPGLPEGHEKETHYKISYDSDSSDSSVDENYDVASLAESIEENLTWRGRMQHILHNHWFHLIIVILVSLDALIVIFELLIDVGAFRNVDCEGKNFLIIAEECHYRDRDNCGPHAKMILEGVNISEGDGENEHICKCGFRKGRRVCINYNDHLGINPAIILHIVSLIILTTFMVEIVLKLIAFRLKYFTHKFEVFDGAIVVISWVLDLASLAREEAFEAASLLIVLRLWRVVRIVNGAILSSKSQSDRDLEETRAEARRIIHAFHKCQDKMDELEAENLLLKKEKESKT